MARYVVLEFESNEVAEYFARSAQHLCRGRRAVRAEEVEATVVGIFAKPTLFCSGGTSCRSGNKRVQGFFRGPKYGWWCCKKCGKPSRPQSAEKLLRHVISQGRNFLTQPVESDTVIDRQGKETTYAPSDVASVTDEGWGASGR